MEKYVFAVVVVLFLGGGSWLGQKTRKQIKIQQLILFPHFFKLIGLVLSFASFILIVFLGLKEENL